MSTPKRHSLLKRFATVSIVALLVASGASYACSLSYNTRDISQETKKVVDVAASAVQSTLEGATYADLDPTSSPEAFGRIDDRLQFVCDQLHARRLAILEVSGSDTEPTSLLTVVGGDYARDGAPQSGAAPESPDTAPQAQAGDREQRAASGVADTEPLASGSGADATLSWWYPLAVDGYDGNLVCRVDLDATRIQSRIHNSTLSFAIPMIAIDVLVVLLEVLLLKRDVSDPLRLLSGRMRSFVEGGATAEGPLELGHDDEIGEICQSYRQMTHDIDDYVERIQAMANERAAAKAELSVAQRIQQGLVPPTTSLRGDGFEAFAYMHMARAVGGDFYDLSLLADGRALIILADVSGKGVSAALFMATCRSLLHERLSTMLDPARALNAVNDAIEANNPANMFVTLGAGIFDPRSGLLTYANAGHTPPILVGSGFVGVDAGISLGVFEDAGIVNDTIRLEPGQGLLLYTDGATDAIGAGREFFGEARLVASVEGATGAEETVRAVVDAIARFVDGNEQFDDLTLLSLFAKETEDTHG